MESVSATARTILLKLQPLGVVLPVLDRNVVPLLALGAGEIDNYSSVRFLSHILLDDVGERTGTDRLAAFPDSKA